jgi:CspA family cold shock protein
VASFCLRPF